MKYTRSLNTTGTPISLAANIGSVSRVAAPPAASTAHAAYPELYALNTNPPFRSTRCVGSLYGGAPGTSGAEGTARVPAAVPSVTKTWLWPEYEAAKYAFPPTSVIPEMSVKLFVLTV